MGHVVTSVCWVTEDTRDAKGEGGIGGDWRRAGTGEGEAS